MSIYILFSALIFWMKFSTITCNYRTRSRGGSRIVKYSSLDILSMCFILETDHFLDIPHRGTVLNSHHKLGFFNHFFLQVSCMQEHMFL